MTETMANPNSVTKHMYTIFETELRCMKMSQSENNAIPSLSQNNLAMERATVNDVTVNDATVKNRTVKDRALKDKIVNALFLT